MKWVAVVVLVLVLLLIWRQMFAGWRARVRRQQGLAAPASPQGWTRGAGALEGTYVSTTDAGHGLERIAVHGLGTRSAVAVEVSERGVALFREGARSFVVPRADIVGVGRSGGMVGKWVGGAGLVVLRWKLGERVVDTGVRLRRVEEGNRLVQQVEELMSPRGGQR
ncbi:ABC transporter permease [Kineococcus glutinatus]|uniref:PH domain-containing protein n=1 Tax=Kineococcus glutinatus TaxID=1070872 RepID=A0ABP9HGV4_9ACTN